MHIKEANKLCIIQKILCNRTSLLKSAILAFRLIGNKRNVTSKKIMRPFVTA